MALKQWKDAILRNLKQYKYAFFIICAGLFLLLLPVSQKEETERITEITENIVTVEQQLTGILSKVSGAGEVIVFLSQATGEEILYQTDEECRISPETSDSQYSTVTVTGADRGEAGLIRQINPPTYLGAIVVCQGADNATVRLAIVEAVSRATGLGADKISVLKMR